MKRSIFSYLILVAVIMMVVTNISTAQVIKPKARGTPNSGPTIDEAQKEDYMGPKAVDQQGCQRQCENNAQENWWLMVHDSGKCAKYW